MAITNQALWETLQGVRICDTLFLLCRVAKATGPMTGGEGANRLARKIECHALELCEREIRNCFIDTLLPMLNAESVGAGTVAKVTITHDCDKETDRSVEK